MSKIQNSTEVGGWDVWVTPAGDSPDTTGEDSTDYFVATCPTLAQACVELLNAIAKEENDALRDAADEIAKLEDKLAPKTFDAALIEAMVRRRAGGAA